MDTKRIITQAHPNKSQSIHANTEHVVRYSIPNEKELRHAIMPKDLPFKALGLQWQGAPCLTTRQLQEEREQMIGRLQIKNKNRREKQHTT
ncbi:conserved hypothetical protein [Ricinus communis]|uniref:Uncharacterized protein n=1 Tax=Ricinus communis TaxID=3988 RepID=B9S4J2_RICCO|nr:conserved hypothetical protein [Ricinus communis]